MNKIVGFLGVLAMVAAAPMARADFQISVNGTTCITVVSGSPNGSATCGIVTPVAGVTITNLSVTGNQLASVSQQLGSTLSIQNTTSSAATLDIYLADSGFTSPTIPPAITIQDVSGATINGTTGTNSFTLTSCVDQSNGLVPPSGTFCTTPAPGMAGPNATLTAAGAITLSNNSNGTITALGAPFSLTQHLVIVAAANSFFNVTSSQVLTPVTAVPEPASIMFLGTTVLGLCGLLRKKKGV